jgi:hypothetical protein
MVGQPEPKANRSGPHHPGHSSQFALAEADYQILERLGVDAELAFLDDLAADTFLAACIDREEQGAARNLARRLALSSKASGARAVTARFPCCDLIGAIELPKKKPAHRG